MDQSTLSSLLLINFVLPPIKNNFFHIYTQLFNTLCTLPFITLFIMKYTIGRLLPFLKFCHFFSFSSSHKISHKISSVPYFIIKLIYKSSTHSLLIFSTHYPLHFLKLVLDQGVTKLRDGGKE